MNDTDKVLGKSVRIYLAEGTPQGILTAEIINWTGHIITAPLNKFADLLKRPEMDRAGIYFLLIMSRDGRPLVYVGESDNVGTRLGQHVGSDDSDWERVCIVTSKDTNLTKAHIKYLESRLIGLTRGNGDFELENKTNPSYSNLPEADTSDMEFFIDQLHLILPVLGLNFLRKQPQTKVKGLKSDSSSDLSSPIFEMNVKIKAKNITVKATMVEHGGEFIVQKDSESNPQWEGEDHSYRRLLEDLFESEKIVKSPDGKKGIFKRDVPFRSVSAAAAVVTGRTSNGRTEWKNKHTKQAYGEWKNAQIEKTMKRYEN